MLMLSEWLSEVSEIWLEIFQLLKLVLEVLLWFAIIIRTITGVKFLLIWITIRIVIMVRSSLSAIRIHIKHVIFIIIVIIINLSLSLL